MKLNNRKLLSIFVFVFLTFFSTTAFAATAPTFKPNPFLIMKSDSSGNNFISSIKSGSKATYMFVSDVYSSQNNITATYYWTIQYKGKTVYTTPTLSSYPLLITDNSFLAVAQISNYTFPQKGTYTITLWTKNAKSATKYTAAASRNIVAK